MKTALLSFAVVALSGCASHPSAKRLPEVPTGFAPATFAAAGASDLWVLGLAPCGGRRCWVVVRTRDGGRSFTRSGTLPFSTEGVFPSLVFADDRNGYAFVLTGLKNTLYATHNGGKTWHRQPVGSLLALATAAGDVYAVTARCSPEKCTHYRFERAPVSSSTWTASALPFTPGDGLVSLAARGSNVWLLGSRVGLHPKDRLAHSVDSGGTFRTVPGPCYSDLGGSLSPATANIVWAVCPTGMMAGALRSVDGGITFRQLRTRPLVNSAQLAAASGSTAVLFGNGAGLRPMRTTDGGLTWTPAHTPSQPIDVFHVAFVDSHVGFALAQTGPRRQDLWRTTDGGAHWAELRIR